MQRMHEGLNHQDVVGLEQEYASKLTKYTEQETKKAKVETPNNAVPDVNEVPTTPANNDVPPVNEVSTGASNNVVSTDNEVPPNNEEDRFKGMYSSALDHLFPNHKNNISS